MYNVLIVDDERFCVDGLFNVISSKMMDLDLYKAYSGMEALELLSRNRMDIVISDINMPGLSGLELQNAIISRWPCCKTIFLTGYDDFNYAREAIRRQGTDYILKMEGDETVLAALQRAMDKIRMEEQNQKLVKKAKEDLKKYSPYLKRALLQELLLGMNYTQDELEEQFIEFNIELDSRQPVWLVAGRVDGLIKTDRFEKKLGCLFQINSIFLGYCDEMCRVAFTYDDGFHPIWFIQSRYDSDDSIQAIHVVSEMLELVQNSCTSILNLSVSFCTGSHSHNIRECADEYQHLKLTLLRAYYIYGSGFITDLDSVTDIQPRMKADDEYQRALQMIPTIEEFFEGGLRESCLNLINRFAIILLKKDLTSDQLTQGYYSIALAFWNIIYKLGITDWLAKRLDMDKLMKVERHASCEDMQLYFLHLADTIFDYQTESGTRHACNMVYIINNFIDDNLNGDLSI